MPVLISSHPFSCHPRVSSHMQMHAELQASNLRATEASSQLEEVLKREAKAMKRAQGTDRQRSKLQVQWVVEAAL